MRTYKLLVCEPPARHASAPARASPAWTQDSRLADWAEMERDWGGARHSVPAEHAGPVPLEPDEPMSMLMLGCLVLASLLSGLLVFSLMHTFVG